MAGKFESYEWKKYKQYYTEENGQVIFNEDTPQFVLDSYALYQKQIGDLQAFPTKKTSGLFGGIFTKSEPKKENVKPIIKAEPKAPMAREFVTSRNIGKMIDTTTISNNIIYMDVNRNVYTSIKQASFVEHPDFEIQTILEKKNCVMVLWNYPGMDVITTFWFADGKITRIQDFYSER